MAHQPAGLRIEPLVSEPMAPEQKPAAIAVPEPLDEPPGCRSGIHGLRAGGNGWSGVAAPVANSCVASLPMMTAPAARSRATVSASTEGT